MRIGPRLIKPVATVAAGVSLAVACWPAVSSAAPTAAACGTTPPTPPVAPSANGFTMPDLTGQFWTDAGPNLKSQGWRGILYKAPDVLAPQGRLNQIVCQSPPPGTWISVDGTITLAFGS